MSLHQLRMYMQEGSVEEWQSIYLPKIFAKMKEKGLTYKEVANKARLSRSTLYKVLYKDAMPSLITVLNINKVLGMGFWDSTYWYDKKID